MRVDVCQFARFREAVGLDRLQIELPPGATVETAWAEVVRAYPALAPFGPYTLFAVGQDYVGRERPLEGGEELCLFPPVSGGSHVPD
jgi:molybdopterin converting factor small subunit